MMATLRGQSNCWIFCKAIRVFPPSMWFIEIIKIKNSENILTVEDNYIRSNNSIYPRGFNLRYNGQCCSMEKLVKYMHDYKNKQTTGIYKTHSGKYRLQFYNVSGHIKYVTNKNKSDLILMKKKWAQESIVKFKRENNIAFSHWCFPLEN